MIVELELSDGPCNEIGLAALEKFEAFLPSLQGARALIIHSTVEAGFSAGADLRELYAKGRSLPPPQRLEEVREFLKRIHRVLNVIDEAPIPTIAAVHGVCFGGGFELALACDMIVADKTARFAFPELRLGLIPGFGGIPRLRRDAPNALVRDLLLTGRSVGARRAHDTGLVSQLVAEGQALRVARTVAEQSVKFDAETVATAKRFIKPNVHAECRLELDLFCELFARPVVQEALRRFVESDDTMPYLP